MANPETGTDQMFDPDSYNPSVPIDNNDINQGEGDYIAEQDNEDPIGNMTPTEHSDSFEPA